MRPTACLTTHTSRRQVLNRRRCDRQALDDESLKASIIAKYSYQDVDSSKREHKPHLPKSVSCRATGAGRGGVRGRGAERGDCLFDIPLVGVLRTRA